MARAKQSTSSKVSTTPSTNKPKRQTAAELRQRIGDLEQQVAQYAAREQAAIQLRDITKSYNKVINTFNKERLRSFLKNIGSNEINLRNLSWYLYYRSQTYARIVHYYANMFYLNARSVIPNYDMNNVPDPQKVMKSYWDTLTWVERMRLQQEFYTIYLICFVQDIFYGVYFIDETGVFIWQIPPDYAKITGKYMTGDFSIAMNVSYFRSHEELLTYMPEPFEAMYREFERTKQQWQPVPDEYAICLKFRSEDFETIAPPFVGMFNSFVNLADLEDIQAIADEQEIYKLIWYRMKTMGEEVDDFEVNPKTSEQYFQRLINEALPSYVTAAMIPGEIQAISFEDQTSSDTNKISESTKAVLNTAGGAEILNGETISGAEAFRYAQVANTEYAISSLLPQTESFVNRQLSYLLSDPCKVKFYPISVYTRQQFKEDMLKAAQYSLPAKLAYMSINGLSELDTLSLLYLENEVLKLQDIMIYPLHSSFTLSNKDTEGTDPETGGRPKDKVQTTDGEDSEDKRDKAKS